MFDAFWKELGEGFGKRWVTTAFGPSLGFWMASLWAFIEVWGKTIIVRDWNGLDEYERIGLVVAGLVVVTLTAILLVMFEPMLIRVYEGYWSGAIPGWLSRKRKEHAGKKFQKLRARFNELSQKIEHNRASDKELSEHEALELLLNHWPSQRSDIMSMQIGNVLRAAESYAATRYGLDAVTVWPRLYFQLPDSLKDALAISYGTMGALLRTSVLSFVFGLVWVPYFLWHQQWFAAAACALGLFLSWLSYNSAVQAAKQYSVFVRTAFDLHRFDLYSALHWPLPAKLSEERPSASQTKLVPGQKLSLFLHRNQWIEDIYYDHTSKK